MSLQARQTVDVAVHRIACHDELEGMILKTEKRQKHSKMSADKA